jgi:hypothetical protein
MKQLTHRGRRTRYLLRRRGMGPAWDEWHTGPDVLARRPDLLDAYQAQGE